MRVAVGAVVALGMSVGLAARPATPQSPAERLVSAHSVNCAFRLNAIGNWKSGDAQAEIMTARLTLSFSSVNTDEGTAQADTTVGRSSIIVRLAGETLHFVQMFSDGPLYVTSIFPKETRAGRLQAVHSRHELAEIFVPGFTSRPEQYYGDCEVLP